MLIGTAVDDQSSLNTTTTITGRAATSTNSTRSNTLTSRRTRGIEERGRRRAGCTELLLCGLLARGLDGLVVALTLDLALQLNEAVAINVLEVILSWHDVVLEENLSPSVSGVLRSVRLILTTSLSISPLLDTDAQVDVEV